MTKAADLPKTNFTRAFDAMKEQICSLLDGHRTEIKTALDGKEGLKGITVALSGRIAPKDENTDDLTVKATISFVPEKITDSMEEDVTNQQGLPGIPEKGEKKAKKPSEILGTEGIGGGEPAGAVDEAASEGPGNVA